MGTALRIFFVGEDDSLHRISMARYQRLINRDPGERMPEYAGKGVRCAAVFLDLVAREPVTILGIQYSLISFDQEGQLEAASDDEETETKDRFAPSVSVETGSPSVIQAKESFFQRQYEYEYKWMPTPALKRAIVDAVCPRNAVMGKEPNPCPAMKIRDTRRASASVPTERSS
ncbi:MAG: hypothetical protein KBH99_05420 [Syntrophobacteraceae bacterium]|nr:hypothetical protein [Syntrophobacteraceae bacterium]